MRAWRVTWADGGTVVVLALLCAYPTRARADNAVPVRDLPPFPDVTSEEDKLAGVTMAGATLAEEDVVVGASKREQSLGTVASAVTIVSAERLRRFGYRTLAEALESVVGLYIVDDRMVERLGIRGVQLLGDANTRILVLVDGSPVNEPWSQYVDTSFALPVNLDDVARVEVIRGPVSSIYGTNAFLGIINIVTLEADKAPRAYGRAGFASFGVYEGNAGFGYGSVDRQVRGTFSFLQRGGETLDYPEFASASPPGASSTHADGQSALNGSLTVNYDRLFFHVRGYDRTRELPGAPYGSLAGSDANQDRDRQLLGEAGYTQPIGERFTLATRVYADRYQFVGDLTLVDTDGTNVMETPFTSTGNASWYGGEVRGLTEILPHGQLSLTTGVAAEWSQTDSRSIALRTVDGMPMESDVQVARDFNSQGVYAEASSSPWPWLAVTAGVRYDRNSLFQNKTSPRGALFLKKGDAYGLKLLYAQGFRNPSVFEAFYADGARYKPSLDASGASVLFPETITSYEAVVWGRPARGLNARVSVWQWDLDKIIEKGPVYDPDALAERLQYKNIFLGLRSRGVEVETSYRDTRGWLGFANATFAQVRKDPDGTAAEVVNSPELTANLGVSTPPVILARAHVSTELSFLSSRHTREFVARRNSYSDAEAFVRWNLVVYVPNVDGFDVTVGVRNILGVREQIPAQSDYDRSGASTYLVPGAGRELFARVGYRY
jgi:outer membrane receptor for ferrienterochelin and colicins